MSEFGKKLREVLLPEGRLKMRPKMRPFVCDGPPQSCEVLIVGTNPANEITTNWLDWWNDTTGFDFRAFNQVYDFVRKGVGTRAKLDILRKDHGLRCVEANVYMNERKSGPGPNPEDNLEVIKLLIASMPRLKVVVEHGQIARRRMQGVVLPVRPLPWEHLRNANDIAALAKAIKERCQ